MSDITGDGHGSSHSWKNCGTIQSSNRFNRATLYRCLNCGLLFNHYYHVNPDIFSTMKDAGIPNVCEVEK